MDFVVDPSDANSLREFQMWSQLEMALALSSADGFHFDDLKLPTPSSVNVVEALDWDIDARPFYECLVEAGFPPLLTPLDESTTGFIVVEGQAVAIPNSFRAEPEFVVAWWVCTGMYPDTLTNLWDSNEFMDHQYTYYAQEVVPCLDAAGFPQQEAIPTYETWVGQNKDLQSSIWDPWSGAEVIDASTGYSSIPEEYEACPHQLNAYLAEQYQDTSSH